MTITAKYPGRCNRCGQPINVGDAGGENLTAPQGQGGGDMATVINLRYCGVDGAGATVREAKLDATRKIEAYTEHALDLFHYAHRGHAVVGWPTIHGWTGVIAFPDNSGPSYASVVGGPDRAKAEASAIEHLLDCTLEPFEEIPSWVPRAHAQRISGNLLSKWQCRAKQQEPAIA